MSLISVAREAQAQTHLCSPGHISYPFFSDFSSVSVSPCSSSGGGTAAAVRLRSPCRAVCQFRRLALKPDMSSSAQLGRQPITMLSRALPQGWKELNTCWLSSLSPSPILWVPFSPTHWLCLSLYCSFFLFSPLFSPFYCLLVIYSFTQPGILHLRLCLSLSWSVVFNLSLSRSNPILDTHTGLLSVILHSLSFNPQSVSDTHARTYTHIHARRHMQNFTVSAVVSLQWCLRQ